MRSGTLNVPGIVALGKACRLRQLEIAEDELVIALKRDRLQNLLLNEIPGLVVNGDVLASAPNEHDSQEFLQSHRFW